MLGLYRQHIESLSTLPEYEEEQPAEEPAAALLAETAPVEPVAEPVAPVAEPEAEPVEQEVNELTDFWEQDEQELTQSAPKAEPEAAPGFNAFQGIRFSD